MEECQLASFSIDASATLYSPGPTGVSENAVLDLINKPRLRSLEHISFAGVLYFTDTVLEQVTRGWPKLTSLDVSATDVTGVGVKAAVQTGRIKSINLNDCRHLDIDAVHWARSQGMEVQYRMTRAEDTGKKVRY